MGEGRGFGEEQLITVEIGTNRINGFGRISARKPFSLEVKSNVAFLPSHFILLLLLNIAAITTSSKFSKGEKIYATHSYLLRTDFW
jgi:hypothetical protein